MRTVVTFDSDVFNLSIPKEYFINEFCYGDDLACWLMKKCAEKNIKTSEEPEQEDSGWYFYYVLGKQAYCACISNIEEKHWLIIIEKDTSFLSALLGGRTRNVPSEGSMFLHNILKESVETRNIQWHDFKRLSIGGPDTFDYGTENP